jgi:hypothetical protein
MVRRSLLVVGTAALLSLSWVWLGTMVIAQNENARGLILIDEAHSPLSTIGMNPSLYEEGRGKYSGFAGTIQEMGYVISTLNPGEVLTTSRLHYVRCLVIVFSFGAYTQDELLVMQQWVLAGGRVLLILDYMPNDNIKELADLFGASVGSGEPGDALGDPIHHFGNLTSLLVLNRMSPHPITEGVREVEIYATTSIVASEATVLVRTDDDTIWTKSGGSVPNAPVMVLIRKGLGEVVVIGDHNLWDDRDSDTDGTVNLNERDDKRLLQNTISYLASGEREEGALVRATPSIPLASAAVAVGAGITVGATAVMSATGLGQQVDGAVSSLEIPDSIKKFLKFYTENAFKHLTKEEVEARRRGGLVSGRNILSLAFSALVLLLVFSYVEVNGLTGFADPNSLLSVMPYVFVTVVLGFVAEVLFAYVVAVTLDVWCEFRIWPYGLIALIVSGFGFLLPFGSPGRTDYEGNLDDGKAGLMATLKILSHLVLMLPFYVLLFLGYEVIGDAGLLVTAVSAAYSSFPFKPIEGQAIYRYSKPLWIAVFAGTFVLFISTTFKLLPSLSYLFIGLLAAALFAVILIVAKRRRVTPSADLLMPQPPPPPT